MKVIPKLQQGNTIESDNTKVVRPEIHEPIKAKPRQYSIVDLGGEPSNDTRSAAERNRDYWHPIKEAEPVMRMGDKEFMTFRQPGTDYIGPIDDVAGHLVKFQMNKGKLRQTSQDMWKFNPADYAKRWNDSPNTANQVRLTKQAALMDKVGRPFILQQSNPIWIEGKSVRNPELVTMAHGGRFDFKKSPLLKKQEEINGKRDMRKKFIKSSRPTYKKRIRKGQTGMRFVSYNPVSNPTIDYTDITNPINPFSEYNYNTTYDKPEALVVPVRDANETDVVANNPTVEPVINKPVASKPVTDKPVTKTANSTWKSPYTNRRQWSTELINAYKKAGITNDNAIRMLLAQDALESSWGKSAQGKYNFGNLTTGSSWKGDYVTGNDKNAKGEAIKQKFRSYNSMDEYAADKVQFLKRLYDFDENDDINKFVAKLTGSNKGKRRYAEAKEYANSLRGVYNSFKAGGIIKYQEPAQPIKYMGGYDKRGNMVLPVTNENGMNNVTLPEVTVTPRNINLAGAVDRGRREAAPYVSTLLTGAIFGPLSVAGGYAGNEAVNKITNVASNDKYKDWADMLSKTTGMNPVVADFFNIGNLAGGFGMRNFGPKLKPVKDMAVGGVPNRAALERAADKMSADGVIFNNVYDNGYSNNQVIFSLRDNLKNSTMTHKPTGKIVTPTENNPYPKIGTATIVNGKFEPTGDIFGEILPTQGTKQAVFHHKTDPTKVVKVSKVPEEGYRTVDELRKAIKMSRARDEVPSAVPTELQGYLQGEKGMYPVFTQTKVGPIEKENVLDELAKIFESKGWTRINDSSYKNSKITVGDITTENVGMLNGKPVIFDPEAAYNKDIIRVSNAKFKNKNN